VYFSGQPHVESTRHCDRGDKGDEQIVWARFTLASGEKVELKPEEPGDSK
jgi:hypothetical protein